LLNATQHYMNLVPDEAKAAIDEAIVRLEETMDGLDSGTIQLIVALGQIKEIF
jgi:flavin-binding protein dodecin